VLVGLEHVTPHAPQLCGSDRTSVHSSPHARYPGSSPRQSHTPFEHAEPSGQVWPHAPQLSSSLVTSRHVPSHASVPAGHVQTFASQSPEQQSALTVHAWAIGAHTHVPAEQTGVFTGPIELPFILPNAIFG
jgi:hypothetical protein